MNTSKRNLSGGRGRGSGGRVVRLGAVSLIVLILAVTAMPFSPNGVSAKKNDLQINSTLSSNSTVRVSDLQVATETPDDPLYGNVDDLVAVTVEPTLDDPIAVGTVQIHKLGCEDDFAGDYYQLAANCFEMDAPFTVSSGAGDVGYNGSFTDNQVVVGTVAIAEDIPDGYGDPIIFCDSYSADGSESGFYQASSESGVLWYDLQPGEWLYCDWFNVPAGLTIDVTGDGSIYINKHACPLNYDPTGASYYDLAADCGGQLNGVNFDLTLEDSVVDSKTTGDDIDSAVNFDGLLPSTYGVTEELPVGYGAPVVFCTNNSLLGDVLGTYYQADAPNGSTDLTLNEGEYIFCDWFNMPSDDGGITIHKWECPEALLFIEEPTVDDYLAACSDSMNGVKFDLSYPDDALATGQTKTTGDDGDGTIVFGGVHAGNIVIAEEIPSGYGDPIVYCGWGAIYDEDGEGGNPALAIDGFVPLASLPGGILEHEMYPNEGMVCEWFNVPYDGGSITIYKYTCPAGYDLYAWDADPQYDCTDLTNGIDFTLYGDSIGALQTATGDLIPGAVYWGGLEYDGYTVAEAVPNGTYQTFVACEWSEELGPYFYDQFTPYTNGDYAVGNRIDLDLPRGTDITCWWYNAPEDYDGGDLVVIKYWCDGNIYDEQHCDLYGGGADFTIGSASGQGDPIFFTTGGDGTAHLYLPSGAYDLYESDRQWCKAESDQVNGNGEVVIYDGQTSYVTVFNCGPGREKEPPVKKFPNTGAGTMTMTNQGGFNGTFLLIAVGATVLLLGLAGANVRKATIAVRNQRIG